MAYNPYSAVNAIYKLKGQWDSANNAGDTATKNNITVKAQDYYKQLRNNGYGDIADELTASNYTQAKAINDKWAKMGKTSTRDYLYSLGQSKGMSQSDIDKLISWDNQTGEVSFGGKKIGTPDTVVDGVSYWSDTSVLDNAFNDYIERSGTAPSNAVLSSQNSVDVKNKINQLWGLQTGGHSDLVGLYKQEYEDLKNTNPFETETGKAILAKYDLAGLQGRDNAVASGAGSNGGNIDSFAAANALRQQSSLINQGQMVAIDAHQQKLDHARALLSDMGVNMRDDYTSMQNTIGLQQNEAQRLFENDETAKNNAVARESEISSNTGYSTDNQLKATSNLWKNGELTDTATDYQARINEVKVLYDNAKTEADKQTYGLTLKLLEMARNDKIAKTGSTQKPTYYYQSLVPNSNTALTREQIASAERIAKGEHDTSLALAATGDKGVHIVTPPNDLEDVLTTINTEETGQPHPTKNGVDVYGARLIEAFFETNPSGASVDEFIAYAAEHSAEHHVDLAQLKQVCRYLRFTEEEIKKYVTDKLTNANMHDTEGWKDGVTWKE